MFTGDFFCLFSPPSFFPRTSSSLFFLEEASSYGDGSAMRSVERHREEQQRSPALQEDPKHAAAALACEETLRR